MANLTCTSFKTASVCFRRLTNAKLGKVLQNCAVASSNGVGTHQRHISHYVQGVRHLQKLKEDGTFCRESWSEGNFVILYDLSPVLIPSGDRKTPWEIACKSAHELKETLKDDFRAEDSVVLNCNSTNQSGPPRFAINIPAKSDPDHKSTIEGAVGGTAVDSRKAFFIISKADAKILSQCLPLLRWHSEGQFCSNCGGRTVKDPPGTKRTCQECSNVHFPRVSPVAIVLVTKGDSCLVVRQPQFIGGMYSAIAGYLEPGESLEAAVRREVAEEVGLEVDEVTFFSSQPWAMPVTSLMLACHAQLKPGTTDQVSLDKAELEDSRWVHRDEVLAILARGTTPGQDLWFPPPLAIAHHLLKSWASLDR